MKDLPNKPEYLRTQFIPERPLGGDDAADFTAALRFCQRVIHLTAPRLDQAFFVKGKALEGPARQG